MIILAAGILILAAGILTVRSANAKYGDDAPLSTGRKVGMVLVFLGIAVLVYVLAINILYHTGRFRVG